MCIEAFEGSDIIPLLMPLQVAFALAWLQDGFYRFVHWFCALCCIAFAVPKNVVCIGAVNMAWRNLCFSNRRSREVLGYDPSSICSLVSEQETRKQSNAWAVKFYADLQSRKGKP